MVKEACVLPIFEREAVDLGRIAAFCYEGNAATEIGTRLTKEDAIALLEWMLVVRSFEQMIVSLKDGTVKPYEPVISPWNRPSLGLRRGVRHGVYPIGAAAPTPLSAGHHAAPRAGRVR